MYRNSLFRSFCLLSCLVIVHLCWRNKLFDWFPTCTKLWTCMRWADLEIMLVVGMQWFVDLLLSLDFLWTCIHVCCCLRVLRYRISSKIDTICKTKTELELATNEAYFVAWKWLVDEIVKSPWLCLLLLCYFSFSFLEKICILWKDKLIATYSTPNRVKLVAPFLVIDFLCPKKCDLEKVSK